MENLDNKTYNELVELHKRKEEEYKVIELSCVREKLTWEEACSKMRPCAIELFSIEQEMRLKANPEITYGKEWKGKTVTIETFFDMVKKGLVDDKVNVAYYAIDGAKSDVRILATDVLNNKTRTDFSHVILM